MDPRAEAGRWLVQASIDLEDAKETLAAAVRILSLARASVGPGIG